MKIIYKKAFLFFIVLLTAFLFSFAFTYAIADEQITPTSSDELLSLEIINENSSSEPSKNSATSTISSSTTTETETPTNTNISPSTFSTRSTGNLSYNISMSGDNSGNATYNLTDISLDGGVYQSINIKYPTELQINYSPVDSNWKVTAYDGYLFFRIDNASSGSGSASAVLQFLQSQCSFSLKTAGVFPPTDSKISIVVDNRLVSQLVINGRTHYYEFVPCASDVGWLTAYNLAKSSSYHGLQGYLATITSQEEQAFIYSSVAQNGGWLGGTRTVFKSGAPIADQYPLYDPRTDTSGGNSFLSIYDQDNNSTYFWACGPEAGQAFGYTNWAPNQPDAGYQNAEAYLQFAYSGTGYDSPTDQWNDLKNVDTSRITGYFIEYGGYDGEQEAGGNDYIATIPQPVFVRYETNDGTTVAPQQIIYGAYGAGYNARGTMIDQTNCIPPNLASGFVFNGTITNSETGSFNGTAGIVVYCYWNSFLLSFHPEGGTFTDTNSTDVRSNMTVINSVIASPPIYRFGYDFKGWFRGQNGQGDQWNLDGNTLMPAENIDLYAYWTVKTNIQVSFDLNGGTGTTPDSILATYLSPFTLPSDDDFERTGYTFLGWSKNANTDSELENNPDIKTKNTEFVMDEENPFTFYAIWRINRYTLSFNAGEGRQESSTESMDSITIKYKESVDIPDSLFTRLGYTQSEWLGDDEKIYPIKDGIYTQDLDKDVVLTAMWEANSYKVTYKNTLNLDDDTTMPDSLIVYDTPTALSKNLFIEEGGTFVGWTLSPNKDGDGTILYKDLEEIFPDKEIPTDITLYTVWQYTVSFDINGGNIDTTPSNMDIPLGGIADITSFQPKGSKKPTYNGYVFLGWTSEIKLSKPSSDSSNVSSDGSITSSEPSSVASSVTTPINVSNNTSSNSALLNAVPNNFLVYSSIVLTAQWKKISEIPERPTPTGDDPIKNNGYLAFTGNGDVVTYKKETTADEVNALFDTYGKYKDLFGEENSLTVLPEWDKNILNTAGVTNIKFYIIDPVNKEKIYADNVSSNIYVLNRPTVTGETLHYMKVNENFAGESVFNVKTTAENPNFIKKSIDVISNTPMTFSKNQLNTSKIGQYPVDYKGTFLDYFKNDLALKWNALVIVSDDSQSTNSTSISSNTSSTTSTNTSSNANNSGSAITKTALNPKTGADGLNITSILILLGILICGIWFLISLFLYFKKNKNR